MVYRQWHVIDNALPADEVILFAEIEGYIQGKNIFKDFLDFGIVLTGLQLIDRAFLLAIPSLYGVHCPRLARLDSRSHVSQHQCSPRRGRERAAEWDLDRLAGRRNLDGGRRRCSEPLQGHRIEVEPVNAVEGGGCGEHRSGLAVEGYDILLVGKCIVSGKMHWESEFMMGHILRRMRDKIYLARRMSLMGEYLKQLQL